MHTMRRALLCSAAVMAIMVGAVHAQGKVEVTDAFTFTSDDPGEAPQTLAYGFSQDYTDGVDYAKGEQNYPPIFPPDGFFVYFELQDSQNAGDFAVKDIRGVPDSVMTTSARYFSHIYSVRIQRYRGQNVTITVPYPLRRGIDSLVFVSTAPGSNFSATFTDRGSVLIPNALIAKLKLTIYYDYERAAAVPGDRTIAQRGLTLTPNPVAADGSVTIGNVDAATERAVVTDLYGDDVIRRDVAGAASLRLDLAGVPSGMYIVRLLDRSGVVLRQGRMVVVR